MCANRLSIAVDASNFPTYGELELAMVGLSKIGDFV